MYLMKNDTIELLPPSNTFTSLSFSFSQNLSPLSIPLFLIEIYLPCLVKSPMKADALDGT